MPELYIVGAGYRLKMTGEFSELIGRFVDKARLLGIEANTSSKAYDTPTSFFAKYTSAMEEADFIIVIDQMEDFEEGQEDIGKAVLTTWFDQSLELNENALKHLKKGKDAEDIPEPLKQAAMLPRDCVVVNNPEGGPPGYISAVREQLFFFFPHKIGPLQNMLENCALPVLAGLCEKSIAPATFVAVGLPPTYLEEQMIALLKKDKPNLCYHSEPAGNTIEVTITAAGDTRESALALAEKYAALAIDTLWPNAHSSGDKAEDLLLRMLRKKKISMAGAVTGNDYKEAFALRMPGVFDYLVNAAPPGVREKALEVPREFMHKDGGVNAEAAMHMAYYMLSLYKEANIGFSLLLLPERKQMALGIASEKQVAARLLDVPEDTPEHSKMDAVLQHVLRFCKESLEPWPSGIFEADPVEDFIQMEEEEASLVKILLSSRKKKRSNAS